MLRLDSIVASLKLTCCMEWWSHVGQEVCGNTMEVHKHLLAYIWERDMSSSLRREIAKIMAFPIAWPLLMEKPH